MDNSFKTLIQSINAQLAILNENGYAIYDIENPEYFISGIRYDSDSEDIVFETMEDESK
ncbi:TPA: hypothetical protein N2D04_002609 [Clostridium botulinum]|uniref:hypothetical protein n=1 Tax=Clostridium botulinum TaxID=1491 RepID=UPI000AECAE51|nr:hypothetical protein [Clostridium botulinum]MCC5425570.1 hypothetical protein [Clostridium botulinum]HCL4447545.1 hypothetical protein [Clostridium botulinum]HCL4458492.1 hypothetical protein [Clostridium botulinum]HCL4462404.1 hypothetical protein [Clostridium botulinum]HCL4473463.1 hypothetical protein [Clostridium botulinum]